MNFIYPTSSLRIVSVPWNNIKDSSKIKWTSQVVQRNATNGIYAFPYRVIASTSYTPVKSNMLKLPITGTLTPEIFSGFNYLVYVNANTLTDLYLYNFIRKIDVEDNNIFMTYDLDTAQTWDFSCAMERYYMGDNGRKNNMIPESLSLVAGDEYQLECVFNDQFHKSSFANYALLQEYTDVSVTENGLLTIGNNAPAGGFVVIATDLAQYSNRKTASCQVTIRG